MTAVYTDEQIAVFDDVLSPEQFKGVWDYCQSERYQSVHANGRVEGFRLDDGDPLAGGLVAWTSMPLEGLLPPGLDLGKTALTLYPTGKAIDAVFDAIKAYAPLAADLVGREGQDWVGVKASPSVMPRGSGVSWHQDSGPYAGAVIFYAHPEWNVVWGGELLVADSSTRTIKPRRERIHKFDNRRENEDMLRVGMGHFVMPKPNRLVFVAPGVQHQVAKVSAAAGNHPRVALAGFFVTAAGVAQMAQEYLEDEAVR
jgi:hypothetical protein